MSQRPSKVAIYAATAAGVLAAASCGSAASSSSNAAPTDRAIARSTQPDRKTCSTFESTFGKVDVFNVQVTDIKLLERGIELAEEVVRATIRTGPRTGERIAYKRLIGVTQEGVNEPKRGDNAVVVLGKDSRGNYEAVGGGQITEADGHLVATAGAIVAVQKFLAKATTLNEVEQFFASCQRVHRSATPNGIAP